MIAIMFDPDPNATYFDIYRGAGSTPPTILVTITAPATPTTKPSYTDKAVKSGTTYTYYVIARNANGSAIPSKSVTVKAP